MKTKDFLKRFEGKSEEEIKEILGGLKDSQLLTVVSYAQKIEEDRDKNPIAYFRPHKGQQEFVESQAKNLWFFGGNMAGKTVVGAVRTCMFLRGKNIPGVTDIVIPKPPNHLWIGGPSLEHTRDVMLEEIRTWMPKNEIDDYKVGEKKLYMKNGSTLVLKSYDSEVEKWQGKALDAIWFDEQPPLPIYKEGMSRVNRRNGYIWGTMTPLYANSSWTYDQIYLDRESDPDIQVCFSDVEDNTFLERRAVDKQIRAFKGTEEEDARLHGKFIILQGLIHPSFDPAIHVIDPIQWEQLQTEGFKFIRVIDLHTRAPKTCCWYAYRERPEPIAYQVDELMIKGTHVSQFADAVRIKSPMPIEYTIVDTPESRDESALGTSMVTELRSAGIYCTTTYESNHLRNFEMGVHRTNDYLYTDKPRFFIFRNCMGTVKQVRNYIWDNWRGVANWDKNPKEKPREKEDHAVRNMHFFLMTMPPVNEMAEFIRKKNSSGRRRGFTNYRRGVPGYGR